MATLTGKVALITAAAQGIGRASALAFANAGARVIATDINPAALAALNGVPNIETGVVDVLSTADIDAAIKAIGRVDVLFNCAGVVHGGTIMQMSDSDLVHAFDLNLWSQVRAIRAVLPQMIDRCDGAIINMATVASSVKSVPNRAAYSISKAAVIGLTKSVAADYATKGIRVNAICPGTVESPSLRNRLAATGDAEAARRAFTARQPMGRIGTAEEIADLAVYLAGATFTSGQIHIIDGGWTA